MLLTKPQQQTFWRLWARAAQAQGWEASDQVRRAFLRRCGFESLTKVDRMDGFTKVLKELELLITPDLDAAREAEDASLNRARVLRHVIRYELLPCLALYVEQPIAFMREVMSDKNRWWKLDRPAVEMTLDDLDAAKLKQLLMTLNARLHTKRKAAGHSLHDMFTQAEVQCSCAACRAGADHGVPVLEPAPLIEPQHEPAHHHF